ncbi:Linear gramicidin synthase subunit D [Planctopirus ephydatiae]|uniref:Linear gramicidin synthase subunit D n=1 Tax=Planctopirus ephydatiae TaxID=2528019 RepID=A0A518GKS0_9PLAN|nr:SDR family oxidoreductase [Planctopirus ephydatiae]QDV29255.1 Linear gramicidin synthase subunit D [Planctopirus ephydatiae]
MSYQLLTGATGLLGTYLLRDLLMAGTRVAVVVRPNRRQNVRQRVETLMTYWDETLGTKLPRPVVLEGDISQADLGLDAVSMRWVAEHVTGVIHNAASLSFVATSEDGEPYRSNIGGTRHVLEFCRSLGIRQFFHVSTAYIAGQRQGRVLETELDVGQELSNAYEESKLASEKMVREADFLDSPTVFRPGIIIGDSVTGYTTTYHGYYAALQLCNTIVKTFNADETGLVGAQKVRLALNGNETKHLVPVDWVSAVMAHVITHPEHHGQTYHLTPQHPVTIRMIRDILEETCHFYDTHLVGVGTTLDKMSEAESIFYEHIRVYNSYWKNDPSFDRTNTLKAAPHLPCPAVNRRRLVELSKIVIRDGFPSPSKRPVDPEFDSAAFFQQMVDQAARDPQYDEQDRSISLNLVGNGGGQWHLRIRQGNIVGAEIGLNDDSDALVEMTIDSFAQLVAGQKAISQLVAESLARTSQERAEEDLLSVLDQLSQQEVAGVQK